jgi:hypothetical protein
MFGAAAGCEELNSEPREVMTQSTKVVVDCSVVAEYAYKGLK